MKRRDGYGRFAERKRCRKNRLVKQQGVAFFPVNNASGARIAALRLQRNGRKVTVVLDGGESFPLYPPVAAGLRRGQVLEPQDIRRLQKENLLEGAYQRCLGLIARRPRSQTELMQYLHKRKFSAENADAVIRRLAERGLANDLEAARAWVENRQAFRPRSKRALRMELRKMGIADAETGEALEEVRDEEAALAAARRKAPRLIGKAGKSGQARLEFVRKTTAFLASRGFDFDLARETAGTVWKEYYDKNIDEGEEA
jgi:regulatory protein